MAYQLWGNDIGTITAAQNLAAAQYHAMRLVPAGVERCAANGERVFGILQDDPRLSDAANVRVDGTSFAVLGAPATRFQRLMTNAQAQLVPAVQGGYVVAIALEPGAAGEIVPVHITQEGVLA